MKIQRLELAPPSLLLLYYYPPGLDGGRMARFRPHSRTHTPGAQVASYVHRSKRTLLPVSKVLLLMAEKF